VASKQQLIALAEQAANKYGVDPEIFKRQIAAESNWNPNAVSSAGARGIAQFMPATARGMGVNPLDPKSALFGAARYMRNNLDQFGGDYRLSLAAYNAGGGAARKALKSYPETQRYVQKILGGKAPVAAESSNGPVLGLQGATQTDPLISLAQKQLGGRRPLLAATLSLLGQSSAAAPMPESGGLPGVGGGAPKRGKNEPGWKYLQRIGQQRFGLRNDAGTSQTYGGGHTAGSEHYDGRAIDFGTAKNSAKQLQAWLKWARSQGYDAIDEGNHIHVSLPGSGI
jgi:hypothetical protein